MNKKTIVSLFMLLLLGEHGYSQYMVMQAKAGTKNLKTGKDIGLGTKFDSLNEIQLKPYDTIYYFKAGYGIKPYPAAATASEKKPENMWYGKMVKILGADVKQINYSSKGAKSLADEVTPDRNQLENGKLLNNKILIEEENKYVFDPTMYDTKNGNFFIEVHFKNSPSENYHVANALRTKEDTLLIGYNDFMVSDSFKVDRYILGFYAKGAPVSDSLALLNPYFDLTNQTMFLAKNLVDICKSSMPEDEIDNLAFTLVDTILGKPSEINLYGYVHHFMNNPVNPIHAVHAGGCLFNAEKYNNVALDNSGRISKRKLKPYYSLRKYITKAGNQGSIPGGAAWACAYSALTIRNNALNNHYNSLDYDLMEGLTFSPEFVYNQTKKGSGCESGTSICDALEFLKQQGDLFYKNLFECDKQYSQNEMETAKSHALITSYSRLCNEYKADSNSVYRIKDYLLKNKPVIFSMHTTKGFDTINKTGIYELSRQEMAENEEVKNGSLPFNGQALCIVGYNDKVNGGSFEVMNSWGENFANNGFFWIKYKDLTIFAREIYTFEIKN